MPRVEGKYVISRESVPELVERLLGAFQVIGPVEREREGCSTGTSQTPKS